jgi:hypothetical protein
VFIRVPRIRTVRPPSRLNRLIFDGPGPLARGPGALPLALRHLPAAPARRRALPCLVLRLLILTASQTTGAATPRQAAGQAITRPRAPRMPA